MFKKSTWIFVLLFAAVFVLLGLLFSVTRADAAGTVTGTVLLSDGVTPANGVTVVINKTTWPQITGASANGTTGVDGSFSISMNQDNSLKAWAVANSDTLYGNSSSSSSFDLSDGETENVGTLTLSNLQFKGTITYPDGSPVSGVTSGALVEVHTSAGDIWVRDELDANGKYSIGGLPQGNNYAWEIQMGSITGFTKPGGQMVTVTDGMTPQEINASLIAAPKHVTGVVSRSDSSPVSGASIQSCPDKNPNLSCAGDHTIADGSYNLYLSPGAWHITMNPDYGDSSADWVYFGFPETIIFSGDAAETITKDFTVTKADARIQGTIKLADGSATLNTDIQCYTAEGRGSIRKTGAGGVFSFLLPPGSYKCTFFSLDSGGRDQVFPEIKTTLFSGETRDLGIIQGKARTSHITGRAHLSTGQGQGGVDVVAWQKDGVGKQRVVSTQDGSYDLLVTPGKWTVGIENGHSYYFYDTLKEVEVTADNQTISGIDIQIARNEATVRGTLKDEAGNSVANQGGAVYIRDAQEQYKFTGPVGADGSYNFAVPTEMLGGDGVAVYLGWVPLPNADFSFLTEQVATLKQKGSPPKNLGSFMFEDVAVDVQIVRDTKTISGGFVDQFGVAVSPTFKMKVMASDGRGNVRVVDVSGGAYSMAVSEGAWNLTYEITDENTGYLNPVNKTFEVEVNPGDSSVSKNITILKANATISGKVTDDAGVAEPYVAVYASNHRAVEGTNKDLIKVEGQTDGQGNYTLNVVGGETYKVGAGEPPNAAATTISPDLKEGKPSASGNAAVDLQYQKTDAKISGTVTKDGKTASGGFAQAWSDEGGSETAEIDSTGKYEVNVTKNDHWHVKAVDIEGKSLYVSSTANKTPKADETANLSLARSEFTVSAPEVKIFQADEPQSLTLSDGTTITAADKTFDTEGEITLTVSPKIDVASQDSSKPLSISYDLKAKDQDGKEIVSFQKPVVLSFHYTDDQLDEMGIDEDQLETNYFDEISSVSKTTGFAAQSAQTDSITVYTNHFTAYNLASPYTKGKVSRKESIVVTPKKSGARVLLYNEKGKKILSFTPYGRNYYGEFKVLTADVNGDKKSEIIVSPGKDMAPYIRVYKIVTKKSKKKVKYLTSFYAYDKKFKKGVNAAAADFDRDKKSEIVVGPVMGAQAVKIYKYDAKKKKFTLFKKIKPYPKAFKGGMNLTVSDVNRDDKEDLIVAPYSYATRKTAVKIYIYNVNKKKFQLLKSFYPYAKKKFVGGMEIKISDVDGDKQNELVVVPRTHFTPLLKIYQYNLSKRKIISLGKHYVFAKNYQNGINLAVGDVNNDGKDEMVVSPNSGYKPQVRVLSYKSKKKLEAKNITPYAKSYSEGIEVMLADVNDNGLEEIVVAPKAGSAAIKIYRASGKKAKLLKSFYGFPKSYTGGVNLASGIF